MLLTGMGKDCYFTGDKPLKTTTSIIFFPTCTSIELRSDRPAPLMCSSPPSPSHHALCLTVSNQLQQSQVQLPLPAGVLVQGDAVARRGKHLARADGHDLVGIHTNM